MQSHFRIGKPLGVPLRIDLTWIVIFVWATWSLSTNYVPERLPDAQVGVHWLVGAATSVLFFASVVLHELGHALVARAQGQPVKQITLFIFGGAAEISEEPDTPRKELGLAIAGPATSLALGGLFLLIGWLARPIDWLNTISSYLGSVNLALGLFNLVPGFPLDGGRVLRALIWERTEDLEKATRRASGVGRAIGFLMMGGGLLLSLGGRFGDGLWLLLVGSFLDSSARSVVIRQSLEHLLAGHTVAEVMTRDCPTLPPQLTLDLFVEHYLLPQGKRCYFVGGRDKRDAMLTVHQVQSVPRDKWSTTQLRDVAHKLDELRTVAPETPLRDALAQMTAGGVNQLPVLIDGEVAGMVTREGLLTFIRTHAAVAKRLTEKETEQ